MWSMCDKASYIYIYIYGVFLCDMGSFFIKKNIFLKKERGVGFFLNNL